MRNRTIDGIISHLLACGTRSNVTFNLSEGEIRSLCRRSKKIFLSQAMLLRINMSLVICGDIHGYYYELVRIFQQRGFPPHSNYLFLGDYVDRGKNSVETICLLLAYKIKYPQKFFVLRGNHECKITSYEYGFYDECVRRYSSGIWKTFIGCFNSLPIAAIVQNKIFCCHGGLSPDLSSLQQIDEISRPTEVPASGIMCDLLWSDPCESIKGWSANPRGISYVFGPDVVQDFMSKFEFHLICRAHQVVKNGFKFFSNCNFVTIFSIPNYCNRRNKGVIMIVDECLNYSFHFIGNL